ncbi:MAG TPA: hypothetical protein PKG97_04045 [Mesotoga infera]|nr:hypothetical protein [Mesotoga infera]
MDILSLIKSERREGYLARLVVLEREVELLADQMELLKKTEDGVVRDSLFESAIIRASKLVRNSGFTIKSFREFVRQSCPRPFRKELYDLLDGFEREETLLVERIVKLKNRRDRVIVHMDPRFAFHPERDGENTVELGDLEAIFDYLKRHMSIFTLTPRT